ncbi:MAG: hypothetical protein Q9182_002965 [Xanthomendoza sp. 2 TL-2023]
MKLPHIFTSWFAVAAIQISVTSAAPQNPANNIEARDVFLWAANFSKAVDSSSAGFGRVHIQYWDLRTTPPSQGVLNNNGPPIPVVNHPILGKALNISLSGPTQNPYPQIQERWEALPPSAFLYFYEGDDYYFRFDFALDTRYPINQRKWNILNQIHQDDKKCCSPPIEFDIISGNLVVQGENGDLGPSASYSRIVTPVKVDTKYKVIYHVKFGSTPEKSLLEVWVNDQPVVPPFHPNTSTIRGGPSYWKGASAYANWTVPPMSVYQNAHRVGPSFASVNSD